MTRLKNADGGYIVLITVLILGVIVSTIAAYLLLSGANGNIATQAVEAGIEARSAATGCAELALDAIQANPTLTTPSSDSKTLSTSLPESCSFTISGSSPNYTIATTGTVNQSGANYVHRLSVTTSQTTPTITLSGWHDTP